MNVPERLALRSGTALYACCAEHAAATAEVLSEVVAAQPVRPRAGAAVCSHCCWCGAMVADPPAFCYRHAGGECPSVSPLDMIVLVSAVRLFRAVFGCYPSEALVDDWVAQAAAGEVDPGVLLAGGEN